MLTNENYGIMQEKYGMVGSWAIWRTAGATPKSNTDDMSWINDSELLDIINTGYVFVGLNWSSTHGDKSHIGVIPWSNFHSGYSFQNDYKLRYATQNTKFWGSYMTDIIKLYSEVDSSKVKSYLRQHPEIIKENIRNFEEEISYLGEKPVIIALGGDAYKILQENLGHKYKIVQIKHYSFTIGKEDYRTELLNKLEKY